MKKMISITLSLMLLYSCAQSRTKFQKYNKREGGYIDSKAFEPDEWSYSDFYGNPYTHHNDVVVFAQIRAIEICSEQGKFMLGAREIIGTKETFDVSKTTGSTIQAPSTFTGRGHSTIQKNSFGVISANSNFSGEIQHGAKFSNSQTVKGKMYRYSARYPYRCVKKFKSIGARFNPPVLDYVANKQWKMEPGIVIDKVKLANEGKLLPGDRIFSMNGRVIRSTMDLGDAIYATSKNTAILDIERNGKRSKVKIEVKDVSEYARQYWDNVINDKCTRLPELKNRKICKK